MPLAPELVSFLDSSGFGHVLAFFGGAVKTRTLFMVNMRFGVNPNQPMTSAGGRHFRGCLSARAFCRGRGRSGWTGCCRGSLRFEQITQAGFW